MREKIIEMAREAGVEEWWDSGNERWEVLLEHLERFYNLAVQHEREACAKVCEDNADDLSEGDWDSACINCADHIRARGEKQ